MMNAKIRRDLMAMSAMSGMLASGADLMAMIQLKAGGYKGGKSEVVSDATCISVAHASVKMADFMIEELGDLGPEPVSADEFLRALCEGDVLPHAEIGHRVHLWVSGDYENAMAGL